MNRILKFLSAFCVVSFCSSAPLEESFCKKYLKNAGYLETTSVTQKEYSHALEEFQNFHGLNISGKVDEETEKRMQVPRCGLADHLDKSLPAPFVIRGKWKKKHLTYKIVQYSNKLDQNFIRETMAKALNVWAKHSALSFSEVFGSTKADIEIRFTLHGTEHIRFDGPGNVLAFAYFPENGDAYFDDGETWSTSERGTSLFFSALHEFGHSLGLEHSTDKNAVMYPAYIKYSADLGRDDIAGIQTLYGRKESFETPPPRIPSTRPPPVTRPPSTTKPSTMKSPIRPPTKQTTPKVQTTKRPPNILCKDPKIDVIFKSAKGEVYVFKKENYWLLTERGLAPGYPKLISGHWKGLPAEVDAAFTYRDGRTYFLKGSFAWAFEETKLVSGYPRRIHHAFQGIPDGVDAAVTWMGSPEVYFYKGEEIWMYDWRSQRGSRIHATWYLGQIDAAFQHKDRNTYFFKNGNYFRSDNILIERSSKSDWFGCQDAGHLEEKKRNKNKKKGSKGQGKKKPKNPENKNEEKLLTRGVLEDQSPEQETPPKCPLPKMIDEQ